MLAVRDRPPPHGSPSAQSDLFLLLDLGLRGLFTTSSILQRNFVRNRSTFNGKIYRLEGKRPRLKLRCGKNTKVVIQVLLLPTAFCNIGFKKSVQGNNQVRSFSTIISLGQLMIVGIVIKHTYPGTS